MNTYHLKFIVLILISLFFIGCLDDDPIKNINDYTCTNNIINTHPDQIRFDSFLNEQVQKGLPGISMMISSPEGIWTGAAGVADIPNDIPMSACNIHQIGSITKTFTAIVILKLSEQGLLDLDDPIPMYLDSDLISKIENADHSSIRNLLEHSSGIAEFLNLEYSFAAFENPTKFWTPEEVLEFICGKDAMFPVGNFIEYSNTNYLLLGMIAENVSGHSSRQLYEDLIFNPLGLDHSSFHQDGTLPDGLVRGYTDEFGNGYLKDVTEVSSIRGNTSGGINSNVEDLHQFIRSILVDGSFINNNTVDEMLEIPNIPFLDPGQYIYDSGKVQQIHGIGFGMIKIETDYGIAYGHNGSFSGRKARMWYFPDSDITITYCFNGYGGELSDLARDIFRHGIIEILFE